jgi:L-asparagine oxygenase
MQQIKREIVESGYAFVKSLCPELNSLELAKTIGQLEQVEGLRAVQSLKPIETADALANTYSGNFGKSTFPLHTDLAHWSRPPRYLMLRCLNGSNAVVTHIVSGETLIAEIGFSSLSRCLCYPRRPVAGGLHLLQLIEQANGSAPRLLRWDSLYLKPANRYSEQVFNEVNSWLKNTPIQEHILVDTGDTLILDNWRVLHGRSEIPAELTSRVIERIYMSGLT